MVKPLNLYLTFVRQSWRFLREKQPYQTGFIRNSGSLVLAAYALSGVPEDWRELVDSKYPRRRGGLGPGDMLNLLNIHVSLFQT